ncbi:TIGR04222 domain-containing membrane protein [Catenuloplanes sp. NPDC020197]|uniref:Uncharacterized protein (TIGR04222 family) n=1 Tax=Catenuloplanes niger TaxID=587534 RepID=A0AAE4CQV2_9ACTN|nr:TIGR04222 domain-containing membrane protein [Catenuloplanes niger]MDR7321370.1 uncharacterized protein (TIGR04222 family) [Catenuloplanes niger]
MDTLAASGDTWGIPGPTFLALYLGAVAVALVIVLVRRHSMAAGRQVPGTDHLTAQQAAYLTGGSDLAVYSAIAGLRAGGLIASAPNKTLAPVAPLPDGAPPLDAAIYRVLQRGPSTVYGVRNNSQVKSELDRLRDDLERYGLALGEDDRRAYRNTTLLLAALAALGVVRLVSGLINGAAIWYLVIIVLALGVTTLVLRSRTPWMTHAGKNALAGMRTRYQYLSPAQSPAWDTYGMTGLAMGVALWGTASLYTYDAAFAAEAEIQRQAAASSGSGGGWSGDGGSTWSGSDSGGGSDGGGSSCGGGGCGGGGCGG